MFVETEADLIINQKHLCAASSRNKFLSFPSIWVCFRGFVVVVVVLLLLVM